MLAFNLRTYTERIEYADWPSDRVSHAGSIV